MEARKPQSAVQQLRRARWGLVVLVILLSALSASVVETVRYLDIALAKQRLMTGQMQAINHLQEADLFIAGMPASNPTSSRDMSTAAPALRRDLASIPAADRSASLTLPITRASDLIRTLARPAAGTALSAMLRREHELLIELNAIHAQLRHSVAVLQGQSDRVLSDARQWGGFSAVVLLLTLAVFVIRIFVQTGTQRHVVKNLAAELQRDPLTGWANRALFINAVDRGLAQALRANRRAGLLFLDLDRFKMINDRFGHVAGDEVLRQITHRFSAVIRSEDTPARVGGDELAIFMPDLPDNAAAAELARRLVACLDDPLNIHGTALTVGLSIGIAIFPANGQSAAELIDAADHAMYRAKWQGGGYAYHTASITAQVVRQQRVARDLPWAARRDQLFCVFQPIFDANNHHPVAVEALIRWRHPDLGVIAPTDWLPLAQRSGLIKDITPVVIDHALKDLPIWKKQGWSPRISINISASECLDSKLPDVISETLLKYNLRGSDVELEITDDLLSLPAAIDALAALKKLGVGLVLDHTNGGYPSLPSIHRLPLTGVKVDCAAIGALKSAGEADLFSAFVALAHRMRLQVTAEGVETEAQAEAVLAAACDLLQGRYYAAPQDADLLLRHHHQVETRGRTAVAGPWF